MPEKDSRHLLDRLAEIEDPRKKKGKRHPLHSLLGLVLIGIMSGHKGYTPTATWARSQPDLVQALGFTHKTSPCPATIHNVLRELKADVVEEVFTNWAEDVCKSRPDLEGCFDVVAIDGKTLRASKKCGAAISHLLSVVSHELGVTLTQQGVSGKTNEIPVSTEILKNFDVSGKVITTDALLTQKTFCHAIIAGNGDYVLPVKNNQPELYDDIQKLFQGVPDTLSEEATHPILGEPIHIHETVEKSHGRLETRCLKAGTSLNEHLDWPGIAQVIQHHYTYKNLNTGEETTKVQYGITSLTPEAASAERLLEIRRGHWSIENKSHWIRDTQLGEDASPVRCGAIPQVMAALRNAALAVLRFAGVTRIADKIKYYAS
ncbi:hypothetical protein C6501_04745, partial [Candidatus Poribacteria bacterium]